MRIRAKSTLSKFLDSSFIRQVMVIAGGTALGQVVVAASSPILTRIYTPEELGLLALFISVLSPVLAVSTLRLDVASVLPSKDRVAIVLGYAALQAAGLVTLIAAGLVWWKGDTLASILNAPRLSEYLWILPVSVLTGSFFQVLSYLAVRNKDFGAIGNARLMQSLWLVCGQVTLGILFRGPIGLFVSDPVGRSSGSFRLATSLWKNTSPEVRTWPSRSEFQQVIARYKRFPLFSVGPAVLNTVALQLPNFLIASAFGAGPTGLYALTQRLLGLPLNLIANSIAQVFLGNSSELARTSIPDLRQRSKRTLQWLSAIGIAVVIPVAIFSPFLFGLIFGENWRNAGVYLQLLAPMFITQFCSSPLGGVLDLLERQDLHLLREVLRTLALLIAAAIADSYFHSVEGLVACLSAASTFGYLVGIAMVFHALKRAMSHNETHEGV